MSRRPALAALVLAAGCARAPAARGPAVPVAAVAVDAAPPRHLAPEDVAADLRLLERALTDAYAPRAFTTDDSWRAFRHELAALATREHGPRSFCNALGGVLTRLAQPALYATPWDSEARCEGTEGMAGGYPYAAEPLGPNVAADAARLYEAHADATTPAVVVVGIRRFEAPDAPGWQGFADAVALGSRAAGVVVDLRGATGSDPTAALPLVAALTGHPEARPLRRVVRPENATATQLRREFAARVGDARERPRAAWDALVGPEPATPAAAPDARVVRVLLGDGCEEACELVARMLHAYAGASVWGRVGSERRLAVGAPGLLVLPRSRVRVYVPTAAYELNAHIARVTGDRGAWYDRRGLRSYQVAGTPPATANALAGAVEQCRSVLADRARRARWARVEPTPCAAYPAVARPQDLPPAARERFSGSWPPRDDDVEVTAALDLPLARARAYVDACPGLASTGGYGDEAATVWLQRVTSFDALSRLVQSEAVQHVQVRRAPRYEPDRR